MAMFNNEMVIGDCMWLHCVPFDSAIPTPPVSKLGAALITTQLTKRHNASLGLNVTWHLRLIAILQATTRYK